MSWISKLGFWRCVSRNPNPIRGSFAPESSCAIKEVKRCWSARRIFSLLGDRIRTRRLRIKKRALFGPGQPTNPRGPLTVDVVCFRNTAEAAGNVVGPRSAAVVDPNRPWGNVRPSQCSNCLTGVRYLIPSPLDGNRAAWPTSFWCHHARLAIAVTASDAAMHLQGWLGIGCNI
jgi:hypothetical protein